MAYGYSRFRKSSTRSASVYGRGLSRIPKVAYRKKTGYYTKNMKGEKKYFDKTYQANNNETFCGNSAGVGYLELTTVSPISPIPGVNIVLVLLVHH